MHYSNILTHLPPTLICWFLSVGRQAINELLSPSLNKINKKYSTVQYGTVQQSIKELLSSSLNKINKQYSTVNYSTVEYSSVRYNTVQYITVQLTIKWLLSPNYTEQTNKQYRIEQYIIKELFSSELNKINKKYRTEQQTIKELSQPSPSIRGHIGTRHIKAPDNIQGLLDAIRHQTPSKHQTQSRHQTKSRHISRSCTRHHDT